MPKAKSPSWQFRVSSARANLPNRSGPIRLRMRGESVRLMLALLPLLIGGKSDVLHVDDHDAGVPGRLAMIQHPAKSDLLASPEDDIQVTSHRSRKVRGSRMMVSQPSQALTA